MGTRYNRMDIGTLKRRKKSGKPRAYFRFDRFGITFEKIEKVAKAPKSKPFAFAIAGIILVLILQGASFLPQALRAKGEIMGAATSAYSDMNSAASDMKSEDFTSALKLFDSAQGNIKLAQAKLDNFKLIKYLAPQASSADHVLTGASNLAGAGEKLAAAISIFNDLKVSSKGIENSDFNQKMRDNLSLLIQSRDLLTSASSEFESAGSIPADYSQTLDQAKTQVAELKSVLDKLVGLEDLYLNLFNGNKTYLLIFQNYDEARATGGFIGTYGVLKSNNGIIENLKIDSIYDLDGNISAKYAAPGPFQPDIKKWGIRDANWFADFPTSGKKLLQFFEQGAETADGVIALTPKLFEDILKLVGPIEMKQYGVILTAENFQDLVQFKTSVDYDKKLNEPKKFLADFAPILLNRLTSLDKEGIMNLLQIFENNLVQKQIMVYSKDQRTQSIVEKLSFSGKILKTDYDYLCIVNSNLGGTKSDLEMKQTENLESKILSDGSIINILNIERKNTGVAHNADYLRVLVPRGSQIISASGFDDHVYYSSSAEGLSNDPDLAKWDQGSKFGNIFVRTESEKTEFAGWLDVKGGEAKTVNLTYILPFKLEFSAFKRSQSYSFLVQRQPSGNPTVFSGRINLGGFGADIISGRAEQTANILNFSSNDYSDDFWGFMIKK